MFTVQFSKKIINYYTNNMWLEKRPFYIEKIVDFFCISSIFQQGFMCKNRGHFAISEMLQTYFTIFMKCFTFQLKHF